MTILAAVAVILACILAYMLYQRNSLVKQLEGEKAELAQQMVALQEDFSSLSSDYENINHQLDTSREQVAMLIEKLSKTEATNRAKIRQYEKELGTLRTIMKGYIVQIDSLNTLNKKLTADAAAARREAAESRRANEELSQQVENLSSQVNAGKVLRARAISLTGYYSNDKAGDRHSRIRYMVASLSLVENSLADKGPLRVFVRVKDPEGVLLMNNESIEFTVAGETLQSTASREVDYEGAEVDMSIYINDTGEFMKGVYTLEVYTEQSLLGRAECMLR
jgi:myosin heavy subunit